MSTFHFSELLGDTLASKDGAATSTDALLSGKAVVALYFSAHWCPPCRGFTPKLAAQYKKLVADGKAFEVVFVSSDRDQASFDEYYGEQPWLALPFTSRKTKNDLSKRYKVNGIPTLVLLDGATGKVLTTNGRSKVMDAESFPWTPKTLKEMLGDEFVRAGGAAATAPLPQICGLYFSAHWCGPCRGFTPELAKRYAALKAAGKELEIVFLSSDKDQAAFDAYLGEMPWAALPYSKRKEKEELSEFFGVRGIPTLVFVDTVSGKVINDEGRAAISADDYVEAFPFHPKPVNDLADGPGKLNEEASVVVLMEDADAATQAAAEGALHDVAESELLKVEEKRRAGAFFTAKSSGNIAGQLRRMVGLADADTKVPRMVLLDIPDEGGFYVAEEGEVTAASVEAFVAAYKAGTLERKQLG